MFGVGQRDHEARYRFAEEWVDVIKRAWSDPGEFDFFGEHFKLQHVRAKPKPFGGTRPMIMNAGSSGTGQSFALRNCDAFFTATGASRSSLDGIAKRVDEVKAEAAALGREIEVYTIGQVICRPTRKEAEDYHRHANVDCADWDAIERMMALRGITRANTGADEFEKKRVFFAANSIGGYPFVGTPDEVAEALAVVSRAGVRGIAVSFVNYLADLPLVRDEVLPRLARMGLRER